jgi:hypothetical protein
LIGDPANYWRRRDGGLEANGANQQAGKNEAYANKVTGGG